MNRSLPSLRSLRSRRSRTQRRTQPHHTLFESLETRQMMAADLAVTGTFLNGSTALDPTQSPSLDVTIKNLNGFWFLDDAGGFAVKVVISDDQTITAADPLMGTTSVGGLGAGQTTTVNVHFSEFLNGEPFNSDNQYWLGVIVDPYNSVSESNENNNIRLADAVSTERDLPSPVNGTSVVARPLAIGSTVADNIGNGAIMGTEWLDGRDIDTYAVNIAAGQSVAFDFDNADQYRYVDGYLRLYNSSWTLVAENDYGTAPGEGYSSEPFLWGTFATGGTYYLVVSSAGNHAADPRQFTGRVGGSPGAYTVSAVGVLAAPSLPDMSDWCDTGVSDNDNITRNTTPEFTFTGAPGKVGQLLVDGTVYGTANDSGGGTYWIDALALRDGFHQVVTRMYDPATGYTGVSSQPIWVRIDTVAPAAPAAADLSAASDHGVSDTDKITNLATPTFTGTAEANSRVRMFLDGNTNGGAVGTSNAAADGSYSIATTALNNGPHTLQVNVVDVAGNISAMSPSSSVTIDTVAPNLSAPMAFGFDTAPHALVMQFSEDVGQTLTVNDFAVLDRATNGTVGLQSSYNAATRTATFVPSGASPQTFAQGNYRAILSGLGVTDIAGNAVAGSPSLDFFFMSADANHDRAVDTLDFNSLAANFGGTNKHYSQADFNYDGVVDTLDFNTLAAQFGRTLAPEMNLASTAAAEPPPANALFSSRLIGDGKWHGLTTDSTDTDDPALA